MRTVFDFIVQNWSDIVIPVAVFTVSLIALFWLRKYGLDKIRGWAKRTTWQIDDILIPAIKGPLSLLCLTFSVYLGLAVSSVPNSWKNPAQNSLWTLFIIAITFSILNIGNTLILNYSGKFRFPKQVISMTRNIFRIVVLIIAVLTALDIWGVPTNPLLLVFAVLLLVGVLAFRDSAPNFFASFHLAATQEIKIGDYIKLEGGEEGYVTNISWNHTRLQGLEGSTILVPNSQLIRRKVVNYGHPLKKAKQPFYFYSRVHLAELTGLKAKTLPEMVNILKQMPDEVIYYHTHHFLEEHQYLIPELSNDFAIWVRDSLGDEVLAERLASVSVFEFKNLGPFRDRLVGIIQEYISRDGFEREAIKGREFHFIKSISVILPTAYSAHDLREFIESLKKVSTDSLYFHIFESRLRLGNGANDFSSWLEDDMGEEELAREVSRIDPYVYTLEGLRSLLIQIIEKRIK
jgi:small-conductance mechanosensitive channel